jgi:MFS family permease
MVARILHGSGRINAGLGAVMTMQAVGVSISPGLGGIIAGTFGYSAAFLTLGALAGLALLVWLAARVVLSASSTAKLDND